MTVQERLLEQQREQEEVERDVQAQLLRATLHAQSAPHVQRREQRQRLQDTAQRVDDEPADDEESQHRGRDRRQRRRR